MHYCKVAGAGCAVERGEVNNTNKSYNLFGLGACLGYSMFWICNLKIISSFSEENQR